MSELPAVRQAQRDPALTRLALAAFDWLRDELDLVTFRPVKLEELQIALARSKPQVIGALKVLAEHGYIERGVRAYARGPYTYRLKYTAVREEPAARRYGMLSKGVDS